MVRPILPPIIPVQPVEASGDTVAKIIGNIFLYAAVLGIFTLAAWIMLRKSKNELNDPKTVPALLTFVGVGLILLLLHGVTLVSVKGMILCMVLMWASISDIAKHEVPDFISAAVLIALGALAKSLINLHPLLYIIPIMLIYFFIFKSCVTAIYAQTAAVYAFVCVIMSVFISLSYAIDALFHRESGAGTPTVTFGLFCIGLSIVGSILLFHLL